MCPGTPVDGMVPAEEEARACDVSPGSSSLRSPEPAVSRCPRCPSCRAMRAAGACGAAKRATTCAWGAQPHTEPNPAPAGDSATSAEPSTRVARPSADATAPARPECRCPSWTLRGHPREPPAIEAALLWWSRNRPASRELLANEVDRALALIEHVPQAGRRTTSKLFRDVT